MYKRASTTIVPLNKHRLSHLLVPIYHTENSLGFLHMTINIKYFELNLLLLSIEVFIRVLPVTPSSFNIIFIHRHFLLKYFIKFHTSFYISYLL